MAKECLVCGNTAWKFYPLCLDCLTLKNEGEIVKCEDCSTWHKTKEPCKCKKASPQPKKEQPQKQESKKEESLSSPVETFIPEEFPTPPPFDDTFVPPEFPEEDTYCIICGQPSYGKKQCSDCFEETRSFMDELNKNSTIHEFRDYYYNLKERIFIMNDLETVQQYCNKLIAIALAAKKHCNDTALIARVYDNCSSLIDRKKPIVIDEKFKEQKQEQDENKAKIKTAEDGHMVKSDMEVRIDDMLYNNFILHCYEKPIDELPEHIRKKSDWFIPIRNKRGIYIEYWGMDTQEYLKAKAEKIALYKEYDIPFISIEKDDPKGDTRGFVSRILQEIKTLAKEKYGFMPEWQ